MHLPGFEVDAHAGVNGAGKHLRAALTMLLIAGLPAGLAMGPYAAQKSRATVPAAGSSQSAQRAGDSRVASGPITAAAANPSSGEIVGIPWTGAPGITETVDQIMERERHAPQLLLTTPRAHREFELEGPLPEDPNAPAMSLESSRVEWTPETQAPLFGPPSLPQTVGTNFKGVNIADAPFIPPDSMGDVGPTQILVHVNGRIRSFTKAGVADGALDATDATFWASVAPGVPPGTNPGITDPEVRYDRLSGRWFLLAVTYAETVGNKHVIAVSSGSTITSQASFTFYSFVMDSSRFCDYPSLGVDANALYTGCNLFSSGGAFQRTSASVVRKTSILSGGPIVVTTFTNIGFYAPRGVDNDDPAATEGWIVGTDSGFTNRIDIRRISTPGGTPTSSATITLSVLNTNMVTQPASGSTTNIDVASDQLFMAAIHKNKLTGVSSLWTAQSVEETAACAASTTAGSDRRIGARWYEIAVPLSPTAPSITQQGNLCTTASSGTTDNAKRGFIYPTVALTGQGHLALASSFASSTEFAGIAAAGRLRTDASGGTRAPETILQSGLAAYTLNDGAGRNRWGDYSFTDVDPNDDQTVWTFQEYADLTSTCAFGSCWSLRVVQLKAPPPPVLATATAVCTGKASTTSTVTGTDSCTAPTCTNGLCTGGGTCPEFFDPIPPSTSDSVGYANHITATVPAGAGTFIPWPTTNIVVPGSPATSRVLQMTLGLNTTTATAGTYTITVTNPDGQAVTSGSAILTVNQTPSAPTASNNGPICAGATLNLSASTVAGATYSWTGPNGFSSSAQNPSIAGATTAASGTYNVTVTVGGCTSTAASTTASVIATNGACGDQTSTTCNAPNTCGAGGVCQENFATSGTSCGVAGSQCKNQDTCNGSGSCIDNGFKSAATLCTGTSQGGGCDNDAADHCTGTSNTCVDVFQAASFTCRASAGQCDVAETCTGSSGACPTNVFASSATSCTGASQAGACDNDAADHCTGTSNTCVDVFQSASFTCRTSAGQCDVAETCTGTSGTCPANGFASSATSCTGASQAGACDNDAADHCTGTSNSCVDVFRASSFTCRASAGQCDVAETCTGTSGTCPADGFASSATSCTGASQTGACDNDAADHCTGSSNSCVDVFRTASFTCRASAGQCDVAETCTGTSGACPADGFASSATSCTGASQAGGCDNDAADHCTGSSNSCVDVFQAASFTCRASAGQCDVAESCTGTSGTCPADGFASSATSCTGASQAGGCDNDAADHCSGTANTCVDVFQSASFTCRASAGQCDVAETCTGTSGTCPADGFASSSTSCTGASQAGACDNDAADHCTGSSNSCVDVFQSASFTCRASAGQCDVAETCTGTSGTCPADGFASSATSCTGASQSDACDNDAADHCTGSSNTCVDVFQSASFTCRASAGECDVAETCTGTSGACPADGFASGGTSCGDAGTECTNQDTCNGSGVCTDNGFKASGTACGSAASSECDNPDSCNGSGACNPNPVASGTNCGDAGTECVNQDTCSGAGTCTDNGFKSAGTACGSAASSQCDNPDTCNGSGACQANYAAAGTACSDGFGCTGPDTCNGSGACAGAAIDCSDGNTCTADSCLEPSGACDHSQASGACDIVGFVRYYRDHVAPSEPSSKPIAGEDVQRMSSTEATQTSTTDTNGQYGFTSEAGNVTLTPQPRLLTDEDECRSAITAADATQIARAAVSLIVLTPNQRVAGDVSNNGTITGFDASLTVQRVVAASCVNFHFPVRNATGSDWTFRPVSRNYTPLQGGEDYNFLGILYGDVTGNWVAPSLFTAAAGSPEEGAAAQELPGAEAMAVTRTGASGVPEAATPALVETAAPEPWVGAVPPLTEAGASVAPSSSTGAVLYLASGPRQNADGSWELVLGLQHADGILGLDMSLRYDAAAIHLRSVTATGIGSALTMVSNTVGGRCSMALYGSDALQGSGAFLSVTYDMTSPVTGVPFQIGAQANEGQIPITGSPSVLPRPRVRVDQ